jgi:hypothetical protein
MFYDVLLTDKPVWAEGDITNVYIPFMPCIVDAPETNDADIYPAKSVSYVVEAEHLKGQPGKLIVTNIRRYETVMDWKGNIISHTEVP